MAAVLVTVAELERARFETINCIDNLLAEYVAKTPDVRVPPLWDFAPVWPPQYYPKVKKILVPVQAPIMWARDKEKAYLALRWGIGHEYWHYVQEVRGERGIPILSFPVVAEYAASKQAVRLSGITTAYGVTLWRELMAGLLS